MRGVAIFSLLENFAFSSNCTKRNILAKKLATIWLQKGGEGVSSLFRVYLTIDYPPRKNFSQRYELKFFFLLFWEGLRILAGKNSDDYIFCEIVEFSSQFPFKSHKYLYEIFGTFYSFYNIIRFFCSFCNATPSGAGIDIRLRL
jgi:hypothetical protein